MKYTLSIFFFVFALNAFAAKPVCYAEHGGYCVYNGKVSRIYINSGNVILLYFDTPIDQGEWDKAGITGVSGTSAAALRVDSAPEFAKLFYSTALAAQASKRSVSIQMRGSESGFLKFDRIWLSE